MASTKPFWQSKTVALGVLTTIVGVATYFAEPAHDPQLTVASISEAIAGMALIILRIWFTDTAIAH